MTFLVFNTPSLLQIEVGSERNALWGKGGGGERGGTLWIERRVRPRAAQAAGSMIPMCGVRFFRQSQLSVQTLSVKVFVQPRCAVACINTCVHVKSPLHGCWSHENTTHISQPSKTECDWGPTAEEVKTVTYAICLGQQRRKRICHLH